MAYLLKYYGKNTGVSNFPLESISLVKLVFLKEINAILQSLRRH